ncbi:MAG TPA: TetR family transcriptional regulator [Solirubrobacteraceae bacterium]|nr:TetR family transcriptional regulator [Solirubrobacteraceae bacterium]
MEIQRARLLSAALRAVDELGYPNVTVSYITSHARVSRRTFYDVFANREDCLLAALESVVEQVRCELAELGLDALSWQERVRGGLWSILSFFEREPMLARVCVVQALRGGPRVLERREQILAELAQAVDAGRGENSCSDRCPPLTAEGLVGAAFAIVYARLLRGESAPLTAPFGELMGMLVLPYLGPALARREQECPAPEFETPQAVAGLRPAQSERESIVGDGDVLAGLPMRLTYRTARVLESIAAHPGASNREAARRAGVSDQGQISKLLSRLERLGLIENAGEGQARGERNDWALTALGRQVARGLCTGAREEQEGA